MINMNPEQSGFFILIQVELVIFKFKKPFNDWKNCESYRFG